MEKYEELGLTNQFHSPNGNEKLNFRNKTTDRDSLTSIEIKKLGVTTTFPAKSEDNVAMAIAVLGVGRVTDKVEMNAQVLASGGLYTEEDMLGFAVKNLRAAMLIRDRNSAEEKQLTEDAFTLYKLAHPDTKLTHDKFMRGEQHKWVRIEWVEKLKTLRFNKVTL